MKSYQRVREVRSLSRLAAVCLFLQATAGFAADLPPLTTVSGNPRLPGKFVWADLVTDDLLTARKFYAQLFGWTFWEMGNYSIALNEERPMCGMFQRPLPKDKEAKPRWFGYISVPNVEKAQRAVLKSGGRVLAAPQKMPKRGEQAVFVDPEGAVFGVVRSSAGDPEDFLADPGDWIWIELISRDAKKAGEFYRRIADYEIVENTSERKGDYVYVSKGFARAAALSIPQDQSNVKPTWLLFVRVESVEGTLAKTKQIGGKVLLEPKPDLLNGKVAVIADPTGAAVGIMEWQPGMGKGGQ